MYDRIHDRLREAACLAHTVPGTTLRLHSKHGLSVLVSRCCLGADLDPCQFRAIMSARTGAHLAATITEIELVAGPVHLGAGLYNRHDGGRQEYWFVTSLAHQRIVRSVEEFDPPTWAEELDVMIKPDPDLAVCAVCVTTSDPRHRFDDRALSLLARCMVDELITAVEPATSGPPPSPTGEADR